MVVVCNSVVRALVHTMYMYMYTLCNSSSFEVFIRSFFAPESPPPPRTRWLWQDTLRMRQKRS